MPARIAVVGAPGTGKTTLSQELAGRLRTRGHRVAVLTPGRPVEHASTEAEIVIEDGLQGQRNSDLTLLMGLDLSAPGEDPVKARGRQAQDANLRDALRQAGISWRVVYGQGPQRVQQALDAVGAALPQVWTATAREEDIGRWSRLRASCEKCGDAACEHRLFTRDGDLRLSP